MILIGERPLERLVIASSNRHKFLEFRDLLAPLGLELLFGGNLDRLEVEETGSTFLENARLKAQAWADHGGLPALADDSGIEVRALDWRPGIYSARIAQDDEACRQWLMAQMAGKEDRVARYAAALVLAFPDSGECWHTLQHCYGTVIEEPRGTNGFGYDPLFVPDGYCQTFGELPPEVKAQISHRAKASAELLRMLQSKVVIE